LPASVIIEMRMHGYNGERIYELPEQGKGENKSRYWEEIKDKE